MLAEESYLLLDGSTLWQKLKCLPFFFLLMSLDISLWWASQTAARTNFLVTHPSTRFLLEIQFKSN